MRPGRRAPGCRGEGPRRAAPRPAPRPAPRHAPPWSPRALGAARAGPAPPPRPRHAPPPPAPGLSCSARAGEEVGVAEGKAEEGKTEGRRSARGGSEERRCPCRRRVFSRPVAAAAAAAAAAGRAAPHGAGCAPLSLRRSLLLPAAALCSRAPCPSARRQPQQQRRRRRLLQAPRRRLHIARRAAGRAPSCLPQLLPLTGPAAPRPGLPAAPPLPAPCRRLTRADTCSPRPRGIRGFAGLLSGAQVAPAALTPALPQARGWLRAPPGEAAGASLTVRAAPRRGHAPPASIPRRVWARP